jgi:hypothetical protein
MSVKRELVSMAVWPAGLSRELYRCVREQFMTEPPWHKLKDIPPELKQAALENLRMWSPLPIFHHDSPVWSILIFAGSYAAASFLTQGYGPEIRVVNVALLYTLGMLVHNKHVRYESGSVTGGAHHQFEVLIAGAIIGNSFPIP